MTRDQLMRELLIEQFGHPTPEWRPPLTPAQKRDRDELEAWRRRRDARQREEAS